MVGTFRKALITVIIVNYNAKTHLARCLDALREQTVQDFHIVLVDNASTDGSLNEIYTNENLTVVRLAENVGFAAANNIGA